jgi:hypothetical protein
MPSRFELVTSSRFERRIPAGRHDLVFKVAFGSDAAAARFFGKSKMTVWRWRHDRSPLPVPVIEALRDLLQAKVAEAHQAWQEFKYFLAEAPSGQSLTFCQPVRLGDGTIIFVKGRQAKVRRSA